MTDSMKSGIGSRPWLVVPIASAAHFTYWAALLYNPPVQKITATSLLAGITGSSGAAWIYLVVGLLAVSPMIIRLRAEFIHLCLWPQQTVLFISAASVIHAMLTAKYPDGYPAAWEFIAADQCLIIFLALGHLTATLRNALQGNGKNGRNFR